MRTSMVELHSSALQTQEIEVGVILMLCHTENLSPFKVKHNLPMTLVLLNKSMEEMRKRRDAGTRIQNAEWVKPTKTRYN